MGYRIAVVFCVFFSFLYALEISTTSAKQDNESFSVLTLIDEDAFACQEITDAYNKHISVECVIDKIPNRGFPGLESSFFSLSYKMIDGHFWLYIYPKHKQKLFGIAKDPKADFAIDKNQPKMAKVWQIVGYKNKIPFLSQTPPKKGLDFPVKIYALETPFIPELNIDNTPLKATKNEDFNVYAEVDNLMKQKNYTAALAEINTAIKSNPDSVFRRDLTYNRILAMSRLNFEDKDPLITAALDWIRAFPADPDIPEILYILADAYQQEYMQVESEHYYRRIMDEYPQSRYAPLAQMQIARIYHKSDVNSNVFARVFFQKAYTEAKDMQSASEIAIEWALFEIQEGNINSAKALLLKVLSAYPKYFNESESRTKEILEIFSGLESYDLTAKIIASMVMNATDEDQKERYLFLLGEHYALAKEFDLAHKANMDYLQTFDPESRRAQIVMKRDDEILFDIKGDDREKIAHYEHIISKYPDTPQAQKASDLIAEILLKQKDYEQIIGQSNTDQYRRVAFIELTKQALANKDCKQVGTYLLQAQEEDYNFTPEEKKQAFDCLSQAGLHKIALTLSKDMAQNAPNAKEKLEWLYRNAHNLYALGDYKNAVLAARDGFNLAIDQKTYYDIAFVLFQILDSLRSFNEAKKLVPFLQQHFAQDPRILPIYAKLIEYANNDQDIMAAQIYAQQLIDLQHKLNIADFTPYAEFALAQALAQSQKQALAIEILKKLESTTLNADNTQRLFYQIASLYNTQNDTTQALKYFNKCINAGKQSDWQTLCKQAYDMILSQNLPQNPESSNSDSARDSNQ